MQYNTHDVVEFKVDGETVTGVVRNCDEDSLTVKVRRGVVEDTYETETVWVEGTTAYVAPDEATLVGSPDTETLHPNDFNVDHHVERLPDEESEDENDAEESEETGSDEAENTETGESDEAVEANTDETANGDRGSITKNQIKKCPTCISENVTKLDANKHAVDMECDDCGRRWVA